MLQGRVAKLAKATLAAAGALTLSACLLTPGKFTSELTLKKGGDFAFTYDGEITTMGLKQLASMNAPDPFEPSCEDDEFQQRDCSDAEIAEQQEAWEAEQAKDSREQEQFAKMFGSMDTSDPETAERLVEELAKMRGWEHVSHRGNGVYDVRFAVEGELTHAFMFPVIEDMPAVSYFVTVLPRADGSVRVKAPGFGGDSSGLGVPMPGMAAMGMAMRQGGEENAEEIVLPDGTFTIVTDGDILTNNTDEGPSDAGGGMRMLNWKVDQASKTEPTALIRL